MMIGILPAGGDPHKLLEFGDGGRPPTLTFDPRGRGAWGPQTWDTSPNVETDTMDFRNDALWIWSGTMPVPMGWDRARRVVWSCNPSTGLWALASEMMPTEDQARTFATRVAGITKSRALFIGPNGAEEP